SMDISKAIDKAAGAEREVVGRTKTPFKVDAAAHRGTSLQGSVNGDFSKQIDENGYRYTEHTAPATSEAQQWDGWGTALKPAIEPIILARKPLDGTVANNVLTHGVGGLNIDACRVGNEKRFNAPAVAKKSTFNRSFDSDYAGEEVTGRFPANVLLDEHAAKEMDEQSGVTAGTKPPRNVDYGAHKQNGVNEVYGAGLNSSTPNVAPYADSGGASRFFPVFKYQAKAPKKERPVIER